MWGRSAAEHLSHSTFVEVPYAGHSLLDSGECPLNISEQFLDNPDAPPDTSCIQDTPLEFYVPQPCSVTAIDTTPVYADPKADANVTGELAADETRAADRMADDGELYWFRLSDGGWVDELSVEPVGDCYLLPLAD